MPFPAALSAGQLTTLRTSGYKTRAFVAQNPNETVFRCRANETITDAPFIQFDWDGADVGAYTDVYEGMVVYISSGTDIRTTLKYRGRVRLAPSSSVFYIDENATSLADGDYITVVRDADLFARIRRDTLVDGSITYRNIPPMISGLPSAYVVYDSDDDGNVTIAFTQTGVAVASGASISSWLWTISGAGTTAFTVGTSTSQNPTIQFQAGYHYLVRCRVTDSNSVQHFQWVQVYAIDYDLSSPIVLKVRATTVEANVDDGYSASITAYGDVSTILDRTHTVVWRLEEFGDDSTTSMVTNIACIGRLRSESIVTRAELQENIPQLIKLCDFSLEGIAAYMQRLSMPPDLIKNASSPAAWGEMVNPTIYRAIVYAATTYTTLANICSITAGDSAFDAWRFDDINLDGDNLLSMMQGLTDRIKAAVNYAPSGEITLQIMSSYVVSRGSLTTVANLTTRDTLEINLDRDTSKVVGQVIAYGGVYLTTNDTFAVYTAQAPTIVYGDAQEVQEITREILEYDSSAADASTELGTRAGNHYAFINPKALLNLRFHGVWCWLIPTSYQRYTYTLATTDTARGIAYSTSDYWWLQSVSITFTETGAPEVSAQLVEETEFTDAQVIAGQLPLNVEAPPPLVPVLSPYLGLPSDPLAFYPTTTPTRAELQPIDADSAAPAFAPLPPDAAADAAQRQSSPRCSTTSVYMRNSGTTLGLTTTAAAAYTQTITGYGQIDGDTWTQAFDFTASNNWSIVKGTDGVNRAVYTGGSGYTRLYNHLGTLDSETRIYKDFTSTVTSISIVYTANSSGSNYFIYYDQAAESGSSAGNVTLTLTSGTLTVGSNLTLTITSTFNTLGRLRVDFVKDNANVTLTIHSITLEGLGTNPFGGSTTSNATLADAFYIFREGELPELFASTAGLLIDGAKPATIPEYNEAHEYSVPYTGTGNPLQLNYALSSYTNVVNRIIYVKTCRNFS